MIYSLVKTFLLALVLSSVALADDLPTVEVIGNKFFFSNNGTQFLMRGIAYQQSTANDTTGGFVDPLADVESCKRDIKYLQAVNTNTIRVYALNTSLDHTECMQALNDAGIYIIADLSEPELSINRDSPEWNIDLYKRYTDVVDKFLNYSNVLGFFAGNEVTNNKSNTDASAFVKAAIRDTKKYISDKKYRSIPVGYSSNDDADTRVAIADYFACGSLEERADFFGINMYEWCGDSTFKTSGFSDRTEEYKNLTIPVFFSEYGCNEVRPRKFTEVGSLFSSDMTGVWSGGIVYMYFEEDNNYGLVSLQGNSVKTLADYSYYSQEINLIKPTLAQASQATISSAATNTLSCPASAETWRASPSLPPTPDSDLCECVANSLTCVVSSDVSSKDYGDLFGAICGEMDCTPFINVNGTSGSYGSYSFCSDKDKLSYVLNKYYEKMNKASHACDFSGSASINKSATTASTCSAKIASVASGVTPSGTSGSSSGSGSSSSSSGSNSSASSTSTKKSSALRIKVSFSTGDLLAVTSMGMCFLGGFALLFF